MYEQEVVNQMSNLAAPLEILADLTNKFQTYIQDREIQMAKPFAWGKMSKLPDQSEGRGWFFKSSDGEDENMNREFYIRLRS